MAGKKITPAFGRSLQQMERWFRQRAEPGANPEPSPAEVIESPGYPFINGTSKVIPAYGVVSCWKSAMLFTEAVIGDGSKWGFVGVALPNDGGGRQLRAGHGLLVNSGEPVPGRGTGICYLAHGPTWVAYWPRSSVQPVPGALWGPGPGSHYIFPGLPGFRIVGPLDTRNTRVACVYEQHGPWWAIASEASKKDAGDNNGVMAYPCADAAGNVAYNGQGGRPTLEVRIELADDVTVAKDDVFLYHAVPGLGLTGNPPIALRALIGGGGKPDKLVTLSETLEAGDAATATDLETEEEIEVRDVFMEDWQYIENGTQLLVQWVYTGNDDETDAGYEWVINGAKCSDIKIAAEAPPEE